jgi:hypothetical protein
MTKNYSVSVVVTLLILCINPINPIYGVRSETQSLEVVGTVVAYDQASPLANITWVLQSQVVLIRISKRIKGRAAGPYIKVVYRFAPNESPLPQNILDENTQWRFNLTRDITCDSSVGEMKTMKAQTEQGEITTIPRLKFKNETEVMKDEVSLRCYVLRPGKYRIEK